MSRTRARLLLFAAAGTSAAGLALLLATQLRWYAVPERHDPISDARTGSPESGRQATEGRTALPQPMPTVMPTHAPSRTGGEAKREAEPQAALPALAMSMPAGPPPAFAVGGMLQEADQRLSRARRAQEAALEPEFDTEAYDRIDENPFVRVAEEPLSTFSIDVDTASYANVRRFLRQGQLPPADAVRVEELVNYFRYDYPEPTGAAPFSVAAEASECPWAPRHRLVAVGLRGRELARAEVPGLNLVFLLDVSGSMATPDKLPLLKSAFRLLVDELRPQDRVAIAVYAGAAGLVLPPTSGRERGAILAALDALEAGGSTAGGAGIQLAYSVARDAFVEDGVNRVILATDGDFNVGVSSRGELVRMIERQREAGIFLSVLGFGSGNLKDSQMEQLADRGNGNYAYIDSLQEARKVLVREAGATLVTIARDVKIQIEWNPLAVAAYRLIGYENRRLAAQDFNDDTKDAGEIGAGHTVTALYEVVPAGEQVALPGTDPLKYQQPRRASTQAQAGELMTVKLRYKAPEGGSSRLIERPVRSDGAPAASADLRWAAAVAAFGLVLRDSEHKGEASFDLVAGLARDALDADPHGDRAEFLELVRLAATLSGGPAQITRR